MKSVGKKILQVRANRQMSVWFACRRNWQGFYGLTL